MRAGVWIEAVLQKYREHVNKETILDIADHEEKVYSQQISCDDGGHIDVAACARRDEPGIALLIIIHLLSFTKIISLPYRAC